MKYTIGLCALLITSGGASAGYYDDRPNGKTCVVDENYHSVCTDPPPVEPLVFSNGETNFNEMLRRCLNAVHSGIERNACVRSINQAAN